MLLELAAGAPDLVTREHLLARVWAGTVVGDNVLDQVIARLRRALFDDARHPAWIETLPKRGYRLMVPVVPTGAARIEADAENGIDGSRSPGLPVVTFLPLAAIGAERSLGEYAQTASEDVANRLAESRSARVITPESACNGSWPTFIAQGTVRRIAELARVSVQLVRAKGGDILWSETFDEPLENATSGNFSRASFVARAIEAVVRTAHRADTVRTRSEEARRQFFLGLRELDSAMSAAGGDWFLAADYFERATDHDPGLRDALDQLAYLYGTRLGQRMRAAEAIPRAHHVLAKLLRVDPNATLSLATVNHSLDLDYASSIANVEHARKHGFADLALVEFYRALVLYNQGCFDEAIERLSGAIGAGLASNEAPARYLLADLLFAAGRYREALAAVDRALGSAGPVLPQYRILRIRIAHAMGNLEVARRDLDQTWNLYGEARRDHFPSVLAALGRSELAAAILRENDRSWREGRLTFASYSFGGHYHLGEFDQAFLWLDRAIENREWWMFPFLRSNLFYLHIRGDARFQRAMRRLEAIEAMGSPTRSVATRSGLSE